jgi:hypothetical protein
VVRYQGSSEEFAMSERVNAPGPGRRTADAAFVDATKEIAERNRLAQKAAKERRSQSDRVEAAKKRAVDARW